MARLLLILLALLILAQALTPDSNKQSQAFVSNSVASESFARSVPSSTAAEASPQPEISGYAHAWPSDTSIKTHPLSNTDIDTLIERGELHLELPGAPSFALTLTSVTQRADIQHLSLHNQEGLPSTISRRGNRFSASLATRTGTFKLRGNASQTLLLSNDELDWRMIPGLADSRRPA